MQFVRMGRKALGSVSILLMLLSLGVASTQQAPSSRVGEQRPPYEVKLEDLFKDNGAKPCEPKERETLASSSRSPELVQGRLYYVVDVGGTDDVGCLVPPGALDSIPSLLPSLRASNPDEQIKIMIGAERWIKEDMEIKKNEKNEKNWAKNFTKHRFVQFARLVEVVEQEAKNEYLIPIVTSIGNEKGKPITTSDTPPRYMYAPPIEVPDMFHEMSLSNSIKLEFGGYRFMGNDKKRMWNLVKDGASMIWNQFVPRIRQSDSRVFEIIKQVMDIRGLMDNKDALDHYFNKLTSEDNTSSEFITTSPLRFGTNSSHKGGHRLASGRWMVVYSSERPTSNAPWMVVQTESNPLVKRTTTMEKVSLQDILVFNVRVLYEPSTSPNER